MINRKLASVATIELTGIGLWLILGACVGALLW